MPVSGPGRASASVELAWGHTLHHIDDLPFGVGAQPNGFTPFKKKVEARSAVRALLPTPAAGGLPLPADRAAFAAWGVEPSLAARGGAPCDRGRGRAGGGFSPSLSIFLQRRLLLVRAASGRFSALSIFL